MNATDPLLRVEDLEVSFGGNSVVRGISFTVNPGECLALVGESGSGKSVTARSLIGLAGPGSRVSATTLDVVGKDAKSFSQRNWRALRGKEVGLILQDALTSLDPLRTVGKEIDDALRLHTHGSGTKRAARVVELLAAVGLDDPARRASQRSGELSGGMRQRALIASAIALDPQLIIADEPTTALDATIAASVMELLGELRQSGSGMLLISHDLATVASVADSIAVMQAGRIVERGPREQIFKDPQHPYTRALLAAVPAGKPRFTRLSPVSSDAQLLQVAPLAPETPTVTAGEVASLGAEGEVAAVVHPLLSARGLAKSFPCPSPSISRPCATSISSYCRAKLWAWWVNLDPERPPRPGWRWVCCRPIPAPWSYSVNRGARCLSGPVEVAAHRWAPCTRTRCRRSIRVFPPARYWLTPSVLGRRGTRAPTPDESRSCWGWWA